MKQNLNNSRSMYVYPKLPSAGRTTSFVRFSGSGLANCLFVYARAIQYSYHTGAVIITPTWFNISIGPYLRKQSDKRHYCGLFKSENEIKGIRKWWILQFHKKQIKIEEGLGNYFGDLLNDASYIAKYIERHIEPNLLCSVNAFNFINCVAVHIRLGDYPEKVRTPISWYKQKIEDLKKTNSRYKFCIFSDGKDTELMELTSMQGVQRVFFGNAIADIIAISRCCYLIGSDSTFSGWGAFLGQVPCCFYRKHYGRVLKNSTKEYVESDENRW